MIYYLMYAGVGVAAGLIAGLFGIGGGMVIVPVLIIAFTLDHVPNGVITYMAIATSLAVIIINSLVSIYTHQKRKAIRWDLLRSVLLGILIGSVLGVQTALLIGDENLKMIFGVFLLVVAVVMGFDLLPKPSDKVPNGAVVTFAGGVIGWVSSMLGIGGGTLSVPYFTWSKLPMKNAVALGAACGLPISIMATLVNIYEGWYLDIPGAIGYVYLPAVLGISITSIPAAAYGAQLSHKLNPRKLKIGFSLLMCVVGLKFIFG